MQEEYLRIGIITSPHGIRGEVNVYPTTDDIRRFSQIRTVTVDRKGTLERMDVRVSVAFRLVSVADPGKSENHHSF